MSMLAERKIKQKWSLNPRGKHWADDHNKFGQKMLEKMGWSKGKGLGSNLQGMTENLKLKYKNDSKGIGHKERDDQWTEHEDQFATLLKALSTQVDENIVKIEKNTSASLVDKSKNSKARIHYKKFTKGKDLTQYSEKDLANVFGRKQLKKEKIEEEKEVWENEEDNEKFLKGGCMADYFKKKLGANQLGPKSGFSVGKNGVLKKDSDSEEERPSFGFGFKNNNDDDNKNKINNTDDENNEQKARLGFGFSGFKKAGFGFKNEGHQDHENNGDVSNDKINGGAQNERLGFSFINFTKSNSISEKKKLETKNSSQEKNDSLQSDEWLGKKKKNCVGETSFVEKDEEEENNNSHVDLNGKTFMHNGESSKKKKKKKRKDLDSSISKKDHSEIQLEKKSKDFDSSISMKDHSEIKLEKKSKDFDSSISMKDHSEIKLEKESKDLNSSISKKEYSEIKLEKESKYSDSSISKRDHSEIKMEKKSKDLDSSISKKDHSEIKLEKKSKDLDSLISKKDHSEIKLEKESKDFDSSIKLEKKSKDLDSSISKEDRLEIKSEKINKVANETDGDNSELSESKKKKKKNKEQTNDMSVIDNNTEDEIVTGSSKKKNKKKNKDKKADSSVTKDNYITDSSVKKENDVTNSPAKKDKNITNSPVEKDKNIMNSLVKKDSEVVNTPKKKNKKKSLAEAMTFVSYISETANEDLEIWISSPKKRKFEEAEDKTPKKKKKKTKEVGLSNPGFDPAFHTPPMVRHNLNTINEAEDEITFDSQGSKTRNSLVIETNVQFNEMNYSCVEVEGNSCEKKKKKKRDKTVVDCDESNKVVEDKKDKKKKRKMEEIDGGVENVCFNGLDESRVEEEEVVENPYEVKPKKKKKSKSKDKDDSLNEVEAQTTPKKQSEPAGIDNPALNLTPSIQEDIQCDLMLNTTIEKPKTKAAQRRKSVTFSENNKEHIIPNREQLARQTELFEINTQILEEGLKKKKFNKVPEGIDNEAFNALPEREREKLRYEERFRYAVDTYELQVENALNERKSALIGDANSQLEEAVVHEEGVILPYKKASFMGVNYGYFKSNIESAKSGYKHFIRGDILVMFKNSNLHEITGYGIDVKKVAP